MFGPAARRIGVGHGRRVAASPSSLVLGNGPEVAALRLAAPRLQYTGAFVSSTNSRGAVRSFAGCVPKAASVHLPHSPSNERALTGSR